MPMLYDDDLSSLSNIGPSRKKLVDRLASSLNVLRTRTPSAVMALVGPWGSGKSTLLAHLKEKLIRDGEWQIATFNPWSYSSLEAAVPGFFLRLRRHCLPNPTGKIVGKQSETGLKDSHRLVLPPACLVSMPLGQYKLSSPGFCRGS